MDAVKASWLLFMCTWTDLFVTLSPGNITLFAASLAKLSCIFFDSTTALAAVTFHNRQVCVNPCRVGACKVHCATLGKCAVVLGHSIEVHFRTTTNQCFSRCTGCMLLNLRAQESESS